MAKAKAKITKLKGRFQIDVRDSTGYRMRPKFNTKAEAIAEIDRIVATKASGGEFLASASKATFDKALDLLLERNVREGLAESSRRRIESIVKAHLRPEFGSRKLIDFRNQRMKFVQDWLDYRAREHGAATMSLTHALNYIKMALDEAIRNGMLGSPNPVTEFKVRVPRINQRSEREVLTLEEISKLISVALQRDHGEHELVFRVRFLLVLFGLLLGLRDQECGALCWDCINLDERMIYVRRKIENGELVDSTKTGKKGYRTIPLSPILYVALVVYRDLLASQGRAVEGRVPVLLPSRSDLVTQGAVMAHWIKLAKKAGSGDRAWTRNHTFYALRHTCLNLWRTIDVRIERLSTLAGHTNIHTTTSRYLHETPHFEVIRSEVHALGLEQTPAGLIDGLGLVLARRWQDEGMNIGCAEPRSVTPVFGHDAARMLPGPSTIDVLPTVISNEATSASLPVNSLQALRASQMVLCKELHAKGKTKRQIAAELGLCTSTISDWIRTVPNARWMRKTGQAERAELMRRAAELRDQHGWSSTEIGKELNVAPHRIVMWERKRGKPMPHRPGAHKLGKYDKRIREMFAEGKGTEQIGKEIGHSHSAVAYYINRLGLRKGSGSKLGQYEDRVRAMVAEGKTLTQITRELEKVSRSGIAGLIKRLGLQIGATHAQESPTS